jgi:hypothetical protein
LSDSTEQCSRFVIRDDLAVAIDMESWEFSSRAVGEYHEFRAKMLPLKETEAAAQGGSGFVRVVGPTPQTLRTQLARPSGDDQTNQGGANRYSEPPVLLAL